MVSKIAVIAIVGILAVPILLGYALNVNQVTETDYQTTGESVNVTQLLQTGTGYNYANANTYQLNSYFTNVYPAEMIPIYETSNVKSSIPMDPLVTYDTGAHPWFGGSSGTVLSSWNRVYYQSYDEGSGGKMIGYYRDDNGNLIRQIDNLHSLSWDKSTRELSFTYYTSGGLAYYRYAPPSDDYKIGLSDTGGYVGKGYIMQDIPATTTYVDLSKGYYFIDSTANIQLVDNTKDVLFTINLDSVTETDYEMTFFGGYLKMQKTTTDGVVSWKVIRNGGLTQHELYYDPTRSDNTYQIFVSGDNIGPSTTPGYDWFTLDFDLRYVGSWPTIIGAANSFYNYSYREIMLGGQGSNNFLPVIQIVHNGSRSPTIRVDTAQFAAFIYPAIIDKDYNPASFKTNPSTTINNPVVYGSSIKFGGNTYNVNKGNIRLNSHDIPIKGLVLSSVPNPEGGYDNKIGNTVISTTADPSTITFVGSWSASITTTAQEEYEVTKTEWQAGSFAWDGMDQNFLMVGLLASLGAFIALGIYARRSRASIWPLLLVCGGAALLFFVML